MKKSTLVLAGLLAMSTAHADEGMWTLYNLPDAVYRQMVDYGFQLPCDMLYNDPNAISNYVVNFSGFCSGVVVSPDGLVFTNHHCGFGAINAHSTVEHDYMRDGFYAKSFSEELPNEDMFVSFMRSQQDITPRVNKLIADKSAAEQENILDSLTNVLSDSVKNIDKTLRVEVKPFYEATSITLRLIRTSPTFVWCSLCQRAWVSSAATPITGCGLAKRATSLCSASTLIQKRTARQLTPRITCLTIRSIGHQSACRDTRTKTLP